MTSPFKIFKKPVYSFTSKPGDEYPIRILIISGLFFMGIFLWVYCHPTNKGYSWLFWLLTFTLGFKLLRMLHEWYHYWNVKPPVMPTLTRTWTVDVFTTFCPGEPYDMIVNTLQAIQNIRYPHQTYLCDEANDPYLKGLCEEMGIIHVTRTLKVDAKAGNINNALKQATGEICLILDPDHIPVPEFLDRVLPYFENSSIGFVQCVQAYYNRKESIVAYGAAEQTYHFYGPMMTCMGTYGTAQAIGANCTFRRAALDSIGGHAAGLSEDMHTAMQLHAKGWESVYVPEPLSYGLVPGTLAAYYKQQIKWSRGTFELLFATYPKLFRQFTWRQKIHYFTIPLYYLFGLIGLIDISIPIGSLLLMELPLRMDLLEFSVAFAPLFFTSLLIRQYAQLWLIEKHEAGFHMIGGILRSGTWWIYTLGLIYTIFRVKVPYIPTPKSDQPKNNFLLCLPNLLTALLILGVIGYSCWKYGRLVFLNPYYQLMAGFGLVNVVILSVNVLIGQEKFIRQVYNWIGQASFNESVIMPLRLQFFHTRYRVYQLLRTNATYLFLFIITSTTLFILYQKIANADPKLPQAIRFANTSPFYYGIQNPNQLDSEVVFVGMSNLHQTSLLVPVELYWNNLAVQKLNQIHNAGNIPLVYWFLQSESAIPRPDSSILRDILAGKQDAHLQKMADQFLQFGQPVLLAFAPEPDNPRRPGYEKGEKSLEKHRQAWRYVVNFFKKNEVDNVSWLWTPYSEATIEEFYPGSDYVDWIGLRCLNYGSASKDGEWHSFASLYQPFRSKIKSHLWDTIQKKPVLITKFGSTAYETDPKQWTINALKVIQEDYPEIKGLVFFQEPKDSSWPTAWRPAPNAHYIDWSAIPSEDLQEIITTFPPDSFKPKRETIPDRLRLAW